MSDKPKIDIGTCVAAVRSAPLVKLMEDIDGRFVSGNEVPVERAHLKANEWLILRKAIVSLALYGGA